MATGERGAGYAAIYGHKAMTVAQYHKFEYMQRRVLQAASEDGMKQLRMDVAERRAELAMERATTILQEQERQVQPGTSVPTSVPSQSSQSSQHATRTRRRQQDDDGVTTVIDWDDLPPLDPEAMSAEEVNTWIQRYGTFGGISPRTLVD